MSRRTAAEGLGTSLLLYVIVGSGIAAETLVAEPGIQLFLHAVVVGVGLGALIAMLQSVSGSHFNPSVTLAFWRARSISGIEATRFVAAQIVGAITGVIAAHLSFGLRMTTVSTTGRSAIGLVFAEGIATFVLVLIILALVRTNRPAAVPLAVGAWVTSAVFATSSTGFANPAVTIGRIFTDTYTGISPTSVPAFLVAQLLAGVAAAALAVIFFPKPVPQPASTTQERSCPSP